MLIATLTAEAAEGILLTTLFPTIRAALGLAAMDLGILVAANKLTTAVSGPFWLWLARRWSRKAVLVVSAELSALLGVAMGSAGSYVALLVPFCLLAAVYSGTAPIATSILADLFDDRRRGRAVGVMYAVLNIIGAAFGAVAGQLTGWQDGWRVSFWALGAINAGAGLLLLLFFRDPGVGAAEAQLSDNVAAPDTPHRRASVLRVFRVPSFNLMLLSRLLSGHLAIISFGVVFLTDRRGFANHTAALVLLPFGAGLCLGSLLGALGVEWLHARYPRAGRVAFLQAAQFGFAAAAYVATQIAWPTIGSYLVLWMAMGFLQGVNPGVNRPIVMSVIEPALRGWAFVIMLGLVEPCGWAIYGLGLSFVSEPERLQNAFLVVLVGVMILNGLAVTPLYWTYPRDSVRVLRRWVPPGVPGVPRV